jgi:3-phosphoshikimate 1-carboxyvinyltransferase
MKTAPTSSGYCISRTSVGQTAEIHLPRSKSLSNRALVCAALCDAPARIHHLSQADDTRLMQRLLPVLPTEIDVADAGTAARFLLALACLSGKSHSLRGTPRMHQRPIAPLVDALRQLGFNIVYAQKKGFLPLHILPTQRDIGASVDMAAGQSSQFLSALMLIAPCLPAGLTLHLKGRPVSLPYVYMTAEVMRLFSVEVHLDLPIISIPHRQYRPADFDVEPDWSAAAVWYGLVAMGAINNVLISELSLPSLQGDAVLAQWGRHLGIDTIATPRGLLLRKTADAQSKVILDFSPCPDLAIALIYTAAVLNLHGWHFEGLQTLDLKESPRLEAIKATLSCCGQQLLPATDGYVIKGSWRPPSQPLDVLGDHRLAMGAVLMAARADGVIINHPFAVSKSYPQFWSEIEKAGFLLQPCV